MSEKVSSFIPVKIGNYNYLFFLVTWNEFVTPIREELEKQVDPFGAVLGLKGKVVQAFRSMSGSTFCQVVDKNWSRQMKKQFEEEQDPFMLIVDRDFEEFDPEEHPWSIIWFSDFWDKPDTIHRLFGALAQKLRKDEDLFRYMRSVARKEKYKTLAKFVELKTPEVFGISIDVKAIIEDLAGISG